MSSESSSVPQPSPSPPPARGRRVAYVEDVSSDEDEDWPQARERDAESRSSQDSASRDRLSVDTSLLDLTQYRYVRPKTEYYDFSGDDYDVRDAGRFANDSRDPLVIRHRSRQLSHVDDSELDIAPVVRRREASWRRHVPSPPRLRSSVRDDSRDHQWHPHQRARRMHYALHTAFPDDLQNKKRGSQGSDERVVQGVVDLKSLPEIWPKKEHSDTLTEVQMAWKTPRQVLSAYGATAELSTINSAEHYTDELGENRLTLHCPSGPSGDAASNESLIAMRWMHIRGVPSSLRIIEDIVTECPYLSQPLRAVALSLLLELATKSKQSSAEDSHISPGTVFQFVGRYSKTQGWYSDDPEIDTEPVTFVSSPFLTLAKSFPTRSPSNPDSLLEFLYGYELPGIRHKAADTHNVLFTGDRKARALRVPSLWSMIIGSGAHTLLNLVLLPLTHFKGILITFSELSLHEIMAEEVSFDRKAMGSTFGVFTIRLVEEFQLCQHNIVIDRDCNFVSFLKHVSSLSMSAEKGRIERAYILIHADGSEVTPWEWVKLLASGDVENHIFGARLGSRVRLPLSAGFRALLRGSKDIDSEPLLESLSRRSHSRLHVRSKSARFNDEYYGNINELRDGGYGYGQQGPFGSRPSHPRIISHFPSRPRSYDVESDYPIGESHRPPEYASRHHSRHTVYHERDALQSTPELFRVEGTVEKRNGNNTTEQLDEVPADKNVASAAAVPEDSEKGAKEAQEDQIKNNATGHANVQNVTFRTNKGSQHVEARDISTLQRQTLQERVHKIYPVPFLTWRQSWDRDGRTSTDLDQTLIQILDKINTTLVVGTLGNQHRKISQCTEDDFMSRINIVTELRLQERKIKQSKDLHESEPDKADESTQDFGEPVDEPKANGRRVSENDGSLVLSGILELLIDRIIQIRAAWLPRDTSASIHPVCTRFWGAVDTIFRQVHWLKCQSWQSKGASWVITGELMLPQLRLSPKGVEVMLHPSQCDDCSKQRRYESLENALEHVHTCHVSSSCMTSSLKPFEDPCLGWIRPFVGDIEELPPLDCEPLIDMLLTFSLSLSDICEKVESIHISVSGIGTPDQGTNMRPHLITSLVHAFEGVVDRFVHQARALVWYNRNSKRIVRHTLHQQVSLLLEKARRIDRVISEDLRVARRDLFILGTTKRNTSRLVKAYVGPEFLLIALLHNVQNCTHDAFVEGVDRKLNTERYHGRLLDALHFKIQRDPRKKRFLEIAALKDNLDAITRLKSTQGSVLDALGGMLSPRSLPSATTEWKYRDSRYSLSKFEGPYIELQIEGMRDALEGLSLLKKRVEVLQAQARLSLEILEEGHGKAIRVFTIVTLFFLPLSFLTSFFGMNTTDIRDTPYGQSVFWVVAVPMTVIVISAAFLYGYKWDETTQLLSQWFTSRANNSPKSWAAVDDTRPLVRRFELNARNDTLDTQIGRDSREKGQSASALSGAMGRSRNKAKQNGIPRRHTGDSLFA